MSLVIFGINIILLMAVWRFILRRSILDHCRDRLFDLRSELRESFIANNWDLNSTSYRSLRNLLNGYLRFTEELSISSLLYFVFAKKQVKPLSELDHAGIDKIFRSSDPEQKKFIDGIRKRALMASIDFAVYGSGFLLLMAMLMSPFVAVGLVCSIVNRQVDLTANLCIRSIQNTGRYAKVVMSASATSVAKIFLLTDMVETYSYRKGIA